MAGELESDSVALERVREYEELPQEAAWHTPEAEVRTDGSDWSTLSTLNSDWSGVRELASAGCRQLLRLLDQVPARAGQRPRRLQPRNRGRGEGTAAL